MNFGSAGGKVEDPDAWMAFRKVTVLNCCLLRRECWRWDAWLLSAMRGANIRHCRCPANPTTGPLPPSPTWTHFPGGGLCFGTLIRHLAEP